MRFKVQKLIVVLSIVLLINPLISAPLTSEVFAETTKRVETVTDLLGLELDLQAEYEFTSDLDLSDINWKPLGNKDLPFSGKIEGNGQTLFNMPEEYKDNVYLGLFTEMSDQAEIKSSFTIKFTDGTAIDFREHVSSNKEDGTEDDSVQQEATEETIEEINEVEQETKETEETEVLEIEEKKLEKKGRSVRNLLRKSVEVGDWSALRRAVGDPTITDIHLTQRIDAASFSTAIVKSRGNEPLTIHGHGHELTAGSTRTGAILELETGRNVQAGKLIVKDTQITPRYGNILNNRTEHPFIGLNGRNTASWHITFDSITTRDNSDKVKNGLVHGDQNTSVTIKGKNYYKTKEESGFNFKSVKIFSGIKKLEFTENAEFEVITDGELLTTDVNAAEIILNKGSKFTLKSHTSSSKAAIELSGRNSKIINDGGRFIIQSEREVQGTTAGLVRLSGDDAEFIMKNKAKAEFNQTVGTVFYMQSNRGKVDVSSGSELF